MIYLLTPKTPLAKKYGFLYESIGLQARFERVKKAWLPHLKNCQDVFLKSVQSLPQKKSVVILGSAHLHEIPMHLLVQNFEEITLVDVIHPLRHHWMAKRNPRLKLITQDLSMILEDLDKLSSLDDLRHYIKELDQKELFHFKADLIVSSNILSQLALLPMKAVEKKMKRELELSEKDEISTLVTEMHLKNLKNCEGKKLIYCDRRVIYRDRQGEVIYEGHYPVSFQGFKKIKDWLWNLAPLKEASKDYSIEMKVEAYEA
jgi:hypothetical protein